MNIKSLVQSWNLPDRSSERIQMTLRMPYPVYAKLHALKEVYPNQSVNEITRDLLEAALAEVIENLPKWDVSPEECFIRGYSEEAVRGGVVEGPRVNFDVAYQRIMEDKKQEEPADLRAVS